MGLAYTQSLENKSQLQAHLTIILLRLVNVQEGGRGKEEVLSNVTRVPEPAYKLSPDPYDKPMQLSPIIPILQVRKLRLKDLK